MMGGVIPIPFTDRVINGWLLAALMPFGFAWIWPAWKEWREDVRRRREERRKGFDVITPGED